MIIMNTFNYSSHFWLFQKNYQINSPNLSRKRFHTSLSLVFYAYEIYRTNPQNILFNNFAQWLAKISTARIFCSCMAKRCIFQGWIGRKFSVLPRGQKKKSIFQHKTYASKNFSRILIISASIFHNSHTRWSVGHTLSKLTTDVFSSRDYSFPKIFTYGLWEKIAQELSPGPVKRNWTILFFIFALKARPERKQEAMQFNNQPHRPPCYMLAIHTKGGIRRPPSCLHVNWITELPSSGQLSCRSFGDWLNWISEIHDIF